MNHFLPISRLFGAFILVSLLGGCQLFNREHQPLPGPMSSEEHQQAVAALAHWQVQGKLIFKSPQKKFSASLNWAQNRDEADLRVTSFLGISVFKMRSNQYSATLEADGETYSSHDPESLLLRTTGIETAGQ